MRGAELIAPRDLRTNQVVAAASTRGEVAHAAVVSSTHRWRDGKVSYTLHGVCGRAAPAFLGRIGHLAFDPDAEHHGWRRTCQRCASKVRAGNIPRYEVAS